LFATNTAAARVSFPLLWELCYRSESWTLSQTDENRLQWVTYPRGEGSVTDYMYYNAVGQRYRARLDGSYHRYVYAGERVLEERNDSGGVLARYTLESVSYFSPLLHLQHATAGSRWPLYDGVGSARMLSDDGPTVTDTYSLDAFGVEFAAPTGTTPNPYRFGGAWGYMTDPSGLLQLGARYYWPELGRFIQQDPIGDDINWYAYAGNNPVVWIDPEGLWEFGGEAYAGIGAGIRFGVNPCGGWFFVGRVGYGVGAGGWFDPGGKSPGWKPTPSRRPSSPDIATSLGFSTNAAAGIGPAFVSAGSELGAYAGPDTGYRPSMYASPLKGGHPFQPWRKWGRAGFGASVGVDIGFAQVPSAF